MDTYDPEWQAFTAMIDDPTRPLCEFCGVRHQREGYCTMDKQFVLWRNLGKPHLNRGDQMSLAAVNAMDCPMDDISWNPTAKPFTPVGMLATLPSGERVVLRRCEDGLWEDYDSRVYSVSVDAAGAVFVQAVNRTSKG